MKVCGVSPARLESQRFPNKLLAEIDGVKVIDRVIINALQLNFIDKLILASDSKELINYCKINYPKVEIFEMYDIKVSCGSERIKYVYQNNNSYDYYISIPADEPLLNPIEINSVFNKYYNSKDLYQQSINELYIRTFYSDFKSIKRLESLNSCKIVSRSKYFKFQNKKYKEEFVLYFSRNVIPYSKTGMLNIEKYKKHIGIFIFPRDMLFKNDLWNPTKNAENEGLEQNMFIENDVKVGLIKINHNYYGVDKQEDIKELENLLGENK